MRSKDILKVRKPAWLGKKISVSACLSVKKLLGGLRLNTVCEEASCPNISECFSKGVATFLILGDTCTRKCAFCGVKKGIPRKPDAEEPERVAGAVLKLGLRHAVITSVTRDDIADGGAEAFARCVAEIRKKAPGVKIEVLVPDFKGDRSSIAAVLAAKPDIFAHNVETVGLLYRKVRADSSLKRSLGVLELAKQMDPDMRTKSGLMLGLGEKEKDVLAVFAALRKAGCDYLSLGQYLAPSRGHYKVRAYITPGQFDAYKAKALKAGFSHVESGPYVRSSYGADAYL